MIPEEIPDENDLELFAARKTLQQKTYLGDGVYAVYDGFHIVLTAENGIYATDTIYLDPHVFKSLKSYELQVAFCLDRLRQAQQGRDE